MPTALITGHIARTFEAAMRDWRVQDVAAHLAVLLDLVFDGITADTAAG